MYRAYMAVFIALSLVSIQTPIVRGQEQQGAAVPTVNETKPGQTQPQPQDQTLPPNSSKPAPTPPDKRVEKIKRTVQKIGIGSKITVFLNNGDELHGAVSMIDAESFQVAEIDLHQVFTLQYKHVKKVRSGYDYINPFTGKRVSEPKGLKIGITAGLFFLIIGLPIIVLSSMKD
jgi:sRNA-binding regulator protein Hfq